MNASPIADLIYRAWMKRGRAESPRRYLGASILGNECDMYLWLMFRGQVRESFDGRMYRLFDRGKREEAVFADDLRSIGCEVKDGDDNGQFAVSDFGGHFGGHLDGVVRGLPEAPKAWHVVEYKTHSDSSFRKLEKEGVRKAKPMHYTQMQVYMGKTGLDRALYVAVDKDDDSLYTERVEFDKAHFEMQMRRAKRIIDTATPERCANRPDDFRCKMCPCSDLCWHKSNCFVDATLKPECRNCCHASADTEHDGAAWTCNRGHSCCVGGCCEEHIWLPCFVKAEIADGSPVSVLYKSGELTFANGGPNGIKSEELTKFGPDELDGVLKARGSDGEVKASNMLAAKHNRAVRIFEGTIAELRAWMQGSIAADWSRPSASEVFNGVKYFEYDGDVFVAVNEAQDFGCVACDELPF